MFETKTVGYYTITNVTYCALVCRRVDMCTMHVDSLKLTVSVRGTELGEAKSGN